MNGTEVRDDEGTRRTYTAACAQLYRCELALHDAHQSGIDRWISAAADRLHASLLHEMNAAAALAALNRA